MAGIPLIQVGKFTGNHDDAAEEWLESFELHLGFVADRLSEAQVGPYWRSKFLDAADCGTPARAWFSALPRDTKLNLATFKVAFLKRLGHSSGSASFVVDAVNFKQREGEGLKDYLHRASRLHSKVPDGLRVVFLTNLVTRMTDANLRRRTLDRLFAQRLTDRRNQFVDNSDFYEILEVIAGVAASDGDDDIAGVDDFFSATQQDSKAAEKPVVVAQPISVLTDKGFLDGLHSHDKRMMDAMLQLAEQMQGLTLARAGTYQTPVYVNTQQGQGQSSHAPAGRPMGGMRQSSMTDIMCFNCTERGHYANSCPLPYDPQRSGRNRNEYMRMREQASRPTDDRQGAGSAGITTNAVTTSEQVFRTWDPVDRADGPASHAIMISSALNHRLLAPLSAPVIGGRIEKHKRKADLPVDPMLLRDNDVNPVEFRRPDLAVPVEASAPDTVDAPMFEALGDGGDLAAPENFGAELEHFTAEQLFAQNSERLTKADASRKKTVRKKTSTPKAESPVQDRHIRGLEETGLRPFNIADEMKAVRVDIPLMQLLDISPKIRAQFVQLCKLAAAPKKSVRNAILLNSMGKQTAIASPPILKRLRQSTQHQLSASAKIGDPTQPVLEPKFSVGLCSRGLGYVDAKVGGVMTSWTMLDSGSGLEIMTHNAVKYLGCKALPCRLDSPVRLADGSDTKVQLIVHTTVQIGPITFPVQFFVVGNALDFDILIGKHTLRRLDAMECHGREVLVIGDAAGKRYNVPIKSIPRLTDRQSHHPGFEMRKQFLSELDR